jgi:hypothetical protein
MTIFFSIPHSVKEYIQKTQEFLDFFEEENVEFDPNCDDVELVMYYLLLETNARNIANNLEKKSEFSWDAALYSWILDRLVLNANLEFDRRDTKVVCVYVVKIIDISLGLSCTAIRMHLAEHFQFLGASPTLLLM